MNCTSLEVLHSIYCSTKGVGVTAPDSSEFEALEDGVIVPLGKPKEQLGPKVLC